MFEGFNKEELEELYSILGPRKNRIVIERIIDLNNEVLPLEVLAANVGVVKSEADKLLAERMSIIKSIDLVNDSNIQLHKKCKCCETLMRANNILRRVIEEIEETCKCYCDEDEEESNNGNGLKDLIQEIVDIDLLQKIVDPVLLQ